ncbi:Leo1-like protein-domain-containing protein [Clohesyomyces aquaticus]|uniref:Leo1-like protein-domain-containing protein n=1 Tax=Clohesyomyces aquaticus TaxID=1231657 RepID=A0A1Y1ZTZ4_9PLEO|nr:Leo1-like protein-domain-containing protein [Clohesyomyces aquaticus]
MASAAGVGAASEAPRLPDDLSDDESITGKVGPIDSDDDGTPRDTVEENALDDDDDDDDDLFGDGGGEDEDAEQPEKLRELDDEDLDSGDDEGRADRVQGDSGAQDIEEEQQTFNFMDADIARHAVPEPSDGELYLLKVPRFLAVEPTAWNPKTFEPPTTDHHSKAPPSDHFSAYKTAMSTIRWRRSPSNPDQLQSNARILRWSDGSLTLQLATEPESMYDINANILAPPQIRPKKPTPTQVLHKTKTQNKESYTYLAAPYEEANVMRITNKITTALTVVPTDASADGALEQLQSALAAAASRGRDDADNAISLIQVTEDPELLRAREEAQFKERQRVLKAKEKHEMREREKQGRAFGKSGARSSGYGLSIGGLEEDGRRGLGKKPRKKAGLQRDWSDDEDYGIRGKTREDEYDEDDGFIAPSEEELEIVDDDDDDDDGIEVASPKRNRRGDDDDEEVVPTSRAKRRRVVEDDDEDE